MARFRPDPLTLLPLLFTTFALLVPPGFRAHAQALYASPTLIIDPDMHTGQIPFGAAAFDQAEDVLVTGSADKTLRLWSVSDGELKRTIYLPAGPDENGAANAVAVSPDGKVVAAGGVGWDNPRGANLYLFDPNTGKMIKRLALPDWTQGLAFSADGRYLAAVGSFRGVIVFDRRHDWAEARRDLSYGQRSSGVAFSKDQWLATTSADGKVRLYDPDFKRIVNPDPLSGVEPLRVAFSPDGTTVAVGYYDRPAIDLLDGQTLIRKRGPNLDGLSGGSLGAVAWSSDGHTLFASGMYEDGSGNLPILTWDAAGLGARRAIAARCSESDNTTTNVVPLSDKRLFVTKANPCIAMLKEDGSGDWKPRAPNADFRAQWDTFSVSENGAIVDFGFGAGGTMPLRFDLEAGILSELKVPDGRTHPRRPDALNLKIEQWRNQESPIVNGKKIALKAGEWSRSYAIRPDSRGFVLGTEWSLRAFDADGKEIWRTIAPGVAWAVNISGNGRLVVAELGDGTIRWYHMDNGHLLLSLKVLSDGRNWVAWTPEGFYNATQGALGVLKWEVNRGNDAAAEVVPVSSIPKLRRADVLPLVLQQLETLRALGIADLAAARLEVKLATGADEAPGPRLYILTIGIDDYGDKAVGLHLNFATRDAEELANVLVATQGDTSKGGGLYAKVIPQYLHDETANREGIFGAIDSIEQNMSKDVPGQDLAVILFSGHGAIVDGRFYLLPHGVNASTLSSIKASGIWANEFQSELAGLAQYGHVLVLIDACHSGAVTGDGATLASNAELLRQTIAAENVSVLTSSSADEVSFEDAKYDRHGAFTKVLLDALGADAKDHLSGLVSTTALTHYVSTHVPKLTNDKQHPRPAILFDSNLFVGQ
jgi:WD40 repeat protein